MYVCMYLIHGLVTNIATQNVIIQKKSSLVVQSSHWSSSSSSLPPPQMGIYCVWLVSSEWMVVNVSSVFTTQKTPRLPMRVSVPYQPATLIEWINVIQNNNKKRVVWGGVIRRSCWCLVFIVYARSVMLQSLPNMARARSARDGPPKRNWLECLPQ